MSLDIQDAIDIMLDIFTEDELLKLRLDLKALMKTNVVCDYINKILSNHTDTIKVIASPYAKEKIKLFKLEIDYFSSLNITKERKKALLSMTREQDNGTVYRECLRAKKQIFEERIVSDLMDMICSNINEVYTAPDKKRILSLFDANIPPIFMKNYLISLPLKYFAERTLPGNMALNVEVR